MQRFLNITADQHKILDKHLFPGDGYEAIAILLCGRATVAEFRGLVVNEVYLIPHEECKRSSGNIRWPTTKIWNVVEKAIRDNMSIVKIHCHPGGEEYFSWLDDKSDDDFFNSIFGWSNGDGFHASLIMLPNKRIFGRFVEPVDSGIAFHSIDRIRVVGEDLVLWDYNNEQLKYEDFTYRTRQMFGDLTSNLLCKLRLAIVGCSGTGSPLIEQLVRLGVGEIHLIDHDTIEEKNLNRILNTGKQDIGKFKVSALKTTLDEMGLNTKIFAHPINLFDDISLVKHLGTMDAVFGCTDSVDSRHLLNFISTYYLVPYFDVGVKLVADGQGGIDKICGGAHYLSPGQSLLKRKVYDSEDLRAAILIRTSSERYKEQISEGYIKNVTVDSPAVISVNMLHASILCLDFLARLHPFRYMPNSHFNHTIVDVTDWSIHYYSSAVDEDFLHKFIGRGDTRPLLGMPELS